MSYFKLISELNKKYREVRDALDKAIHVYHLPLYECNSRINTMKRIEHALYNMILASNSISTETDYKACTTTITDNITGEIIIVPFIIKAKK